MDACGSLTAERPVNRVAAVARVALSQGAGADCPIYQGILQRALAEEPPPFGEESYERIFREAAGDGQWLAISLITNAEREGDGATRLRSLVACSEIESEQALLKRHAVDESSLARLPGAARPLVSMGGLVGAPPALDQLSPGYAMAKALRAREGSPYARVPSIDDYIQMNIAEIRTTLHHLMQREAIATHCPARQSAARGQDPQLAAA